MTIEVREYATEGHRLLLESPHAPSEIARLAGLPRPRISDWRAGRTKPNDADRRALEKATGIPPRAWDAPPLAAAPAVATKPTPRAELPAGSPSTTTLDVEVDERELAGLGLDGLERLARRFEALVPSLPPKDRIRAIESHARTLAAHEALRQKNADARAEWYASPEFRRDVAILATAFPDAPAFRERLRHLGVDLPAPPSAATALPPAPPPTLDALVAQLQAAQRLRDGGEPLLALGQTLRLGIVANAGAIARLLLEAPNRVPEILALLDPADEHAVRSAVERQMAIADLRKLEPTVRGTLAEFLRELGHPDEARAIEEGGVSC